MYNLIISIVAGLLGFVVMSFVVGGGDFKPLYGLVPGIGILLGVYFVLARRTMQKVEEIMKEAQDVLATAQASGKPMTSMRQAEQHMNKAIAILKKGYEHEKWQFFIKAQLDGQIGQLLYMSKKYDSAENYLKNAMKQHWMAHAMLGTLYYKRKDYSSMVDAFEVAVEGSPKEALLWNVYAYCLWKSSQKDKAISVLERALEHVSSDERTRDNLKALQNNKKMKMRGWNMMWYQFHLDTPPQPKMPQPKMRHQRR